MAGYPPPYPPQPPQGPPYGGPFGNDWKYQRRALRNQARAQRDMFRAQREAYRAQYRGMRRGSIVGPILVISIGILFLLVQIGKLPSHMLWMWFGHWWPLLLIGVGIVVLIEWGYDQRFGHGEGQPYFRRSIGGGVVTLLIILVVAGLASQGIHDGGTPFNQTFNFNQEDFDQFMGDKHESDQTLAEAFPLNGTFEVDNPRGDITLAGTSDDNQVHVMLHKEIYSRSDSDAASKAQQLNPSLNVNGSSVRLTLPPLDGARANLIITVPAASSNTVTANHGDIHVSGLKGPVNITANHGDVEVSAITGAVTAHIQNSKSDFAVHSVTGQVTLEGKGGDVTISDITGNASVQGDFFGDIHLEHVSGGFKFHSSRTDFQVARLDGEANFTEDDLSAEQAAGPVVLSTRNRNVTLDRIAGDITVTNKNGKVDLTSAPPLGNVSVENRNGEVSLTLPEQAAFNVHAETSDANIQNDFSLPVMDNDNHKSMSGTVGKGNATIRISTTQEDVSLRRASIAPLPPAPPAPPALTAMPAEAQQAVKDAGREARRAAEEGRKAAEEARKAAKEAAQQQ